MDIIGSPRLRDEPLTYIQYAYGYEGSEALEYTSTRVELTEGASLQWGIYPFDTRCNTVPLWLFHGGGSAVIRNSIEELYHGTDLKMQIFQTVSEDWYLDILVREPEQGMVVSDPLLEVPQEFVPEGLTLIRSQKVYNSGRSFGYHSKDKPSMQRLQMLYDYLVLRYFL